MSWRQLNDVAEEHQTLYSIKTPPGEMFPLEASRAKNFEVVDLPLTKDGKQGSSNMFRDKEDPRAKSVSSRYCLRLGQSRNRNQECHQLGKS
jgi:hypothetical protein